MLMKNRKHHIIMTLVALFLGMAVAVQGMPIKTEPCVEAACCCCTISPAPQAGPTHFSAQRTVTCKGRKNCCQIQEKRASHEAAMNIAPGFSDRPTLSRNDARIDAHFPGKTAPAIALRSDLKWPHGTAMPIIYQTLTILC